MLNICIIKFYHFNKQKVNYYNFNIIILISKQILEKPTIVLQYIYVMI